MEEGDNKKAHKKHAKRSQVSETKTTMFHIAQKFNMKRGNQTRDVSQSETPHLNLLLAFPSHRRVPQTTSSHRLTPNVLPYLKFVLMVFGECERRREFQPPRWGTPTVLQDIPFSTNQKYSACSNDISK